jgi:glycosyltransferase involved in cell wall biosynthesis
MRDGKEQSVERSYPLVVVVCVTFPTEENNRLEFLARTLVDIEDQAASGYVDFEVFIIDDGSPLQSQVFDMAKVWGEAMFANYGINVGFKPLDTNTGGQGYGFNWAMMMAQSSLIAYHDDDDEWDSNYLARMTSEFVKPGVDFVYARWRVDTTEPCPPAYKNFIKGDGDIAEFPSTRYAKGALTRGGAAHNFISPCYSVHSIGAAVIQCLYATGKLWNDNTQRYNDWEFFSRWERQGCRFTFVDEVLGQVHFHGANITTTPEVKDETSINTGKQAKGAEAWHKSRQSCSDLVQAVLTR